MKCMFVVYHDLNTEARSMEILEVSKIIGETVLVSYLKPKSSSNIRFIETGNGKRNYFRFVLDSIVALWKEKPEILILHDNYTAIFLLLARIICKNTYIIYDSSELYIDQKYTNLKLILASHMNYFEKKYIKFANIVIAANKERADIMFEYFNLPKIPIVFDNMHLIFDEYDQNHCEKKYSEYLEKNTFNIVYGGGISEARLTYELAEAVGYLGKEYQLLIVGLTTEKEKIKFKEFIEKKGIINVFYLGFLPRDEWRFLLTNSKLSVSAFSQDTLNNKYCASGKLYESLFEGIPILTSENPPLKRICEENQIGISTSNFSEGIVQIKENYQYYSENVRYFVNKLDYNGRINQLASTIIQDIESTLT